MDRGSRAALLQNSALRDISRRRSNAIIVASRECHHAVRCLVDALLMSQADIAAAGNALADMARDHGPLSQLVNRHLRPSGSFQRYAYLDDAALLRIAWARSAAGINRIYRVYALGKPMRYPQIDAMLRAGDNPRFAESLAAVLEAAAHSADADGEMFFSRWSRAAISLLTLNERDEAIRFEPLPQGENRAALRRAQRVNWRSFRYSAILVPGEGLDDGQQGLSPIGAARVKLAVRRFEEGLAPFLVVSGGYVHPNRTPYNEALEMKRQLMRRYRIPENAIFVDPYARHTTTNIRNAVRIMFRAGAPMDSMMLVTTTPEQRAYIEGSGFKERCERELGYLPFRSARRLSENDVSFAPNITSLQINGDDPLDP